jgi:DNA-binding HxlR family transcriptional regulator
MHRTCFKAMPCPIARSLEKVGEWWSILILRDACRGMTRFDEFQKSLGTSTNTLTRRLNALVEQGLLDRRKYSDRPLRHEYLLTTAGRDIAPILQAFMTWGIQHAGMTSELPAPLHPTAH